MQKKLIISLLLLLSMTLVWLLLFWNPVTEQAALTDQHLALGKAPTGGNFTVNTLGKKVSLDDFKGKVVLLYFGYTHCPDICPTSLSLMSQAFNKMDKVELDKVQGLFISVDPGRDTPEKLADYTRYFHPNIMGATSNKQTLDKIVQQYGASYRLVKSDSAMGYSVDHSSATYLIDQKGKLRKTLEHATPPTKILEVVRELLRKP